MPLPNFTRANQRIIRRPTNPFDKSTIVSIYPKKIIEVKPTVDPGRFEIEAAKRDDFELLVVGPSSWFREVDQFQPLLEVVNSSAEVAESVIKDYCNGLLGYEPGVATPGLFWIPGKFDKKTILDYVETKVNEATGGVISKKTFSQLMEEARTRQRNWFDSLIRMADYLWANSNGHPMSISDDMRLAAQELNLNPIWLQASRDLKKVNCKACGTMIDPNFPVCPNCKMVVDAEKAKALGLKFAV